MGQVNFKNSGVSWIGDIPSDWELVRLKYLIRNKITDGPHETPTFQYEGIPFLSVDGIQDGELVFDGCRFITTEEHERFKQKCVVEKGDVLMGKAASIGKIARVKVDFEFSIWSPLALIKPKLDTINPIYIEYFLKSSLGQYQIEQLSTSNTQKNISMEAIPNIKVVVPPLEEQVKISAFIEDKTVEINHLIAKKTLLIEKLKEKRVAVINNAISKGTNSKVKLKSSGITAFGDIPSHWEVKRIKYVCKIQGRIGFKGYKSSDLVSEGEGAITLGATHITRNHKIDLTEAVYLNWDKYYESPEIMVKMGDVVFTQRGAYLGKVALIDKDYGKITINPSLILLKEIFIHSGYLTYYLTSHYIRQNIAIISNSTAIPMISQEQLANFYCLVPPLEEQKEIFEFIENENTIVDNTISKIEKEIELIREYHKSLINSIVTGKISLN